MGWGPTWNVRYYDGACPHRAPHLATFATDFTGQNPFGSSSPLRMYVR